MPPTPIDFHFARLLLDPGLLNHYRPFIAEAEKSLWNRRSATALLLKAIRAVHKDQHLATRSLGILELGAALEDQRERYLSAVAKAAPEYLNECCSQWQIHSIGIVQAAGEIEQQASSATAEIQRQEKIAGETKFRHWLDKENLESYFVVDPNLLFNPNFGAHSRVQQAIEKQKALENHPWFYQKRAPLSPLFSNFQISREPRFPTYIHTFDHGSLEGGVELQTTILLAGVTNTGKSQLLRHTLQQASCHGQPSIYFSNEDSTDLIKKRSLSSLLKIPTKLIKDKSEAELERMLERACQTWDEINTGLGTQIYNNIRRKFFAVYLERDQFRPEVMEDYVKEAEDQLGTALRYAGADYLQEGVPNGGIRSYETPASALRRWMAETKESAIRHNLAFFVVAQAKGEAVGRAAPEINQIVAESFSATWGANYILAIIRSADETARVQRTNDTRYRQEVLLAKSKDTPLGLTFALCDFSTSTWIFFDSKEARDRAADAATRHDRPNQSSAQDSTDPDDDSDPTLQDLQQAVQNANLPH